MPRTAVTVSVESMSNFVAIMKQRGVKLVDLYKTRGDHTVTVVLAHSEIAKDVAYTTKALIEKFGGDLTEKLAEDTAKPSEDTAKSAPRATSSRLKGFSPGRKV